MSTDDHTTHELSTETRGTSKAETKRSVSNIEADCKQ